MLNSGFLMQVRSRACQLTNSSDFLTGKVPKYQLSVRPWEPFYTYSCPILCPDQRRNIDYNSLSQCNHRPGARFKQNNMIPFWSAALGHMVSRILGALYLRGYLSLVAARVLRAHSAWKEASESPGRSHADARGLEDHLLRLSRSPSRNTWCSKRVYTKSLRCYDHFYQAKLHFKETLYQRED